MCVRSEPADDTLRINYSGKVNLEFENALRLLAEQFGWTWYGQGVNNDTRERNLSFFQTRDEHTSRR